MVLGAKSRPRGNARVGRVKFVISVAHNVIIRLKTRREITILQTV